MKQLKNQQISSIVEAAAGGYIAQQSLAEINNSLVAAIEDLAESFADSIDDFAEDFAGDPPNVAVTGWRKRKKKGGWRRAYAVVTATSVAFDAAAGDLRYAVVQFPGQAGVTKGFRGGGEGGDPSHWVARLKFAQTEMWRP